jgi:hypothetical protein
MKTNMSCQTSLCHGTDAKTLIKFNGSRLSNKQTIRFSFDVIKEKAFLQTANNNIVTLLN